VTRLTDDCNHGRQAEYKAVYALFRETTPKENHLCDKKIEVLLKMLLYAPTHIYFYVYFFTMKVEVH